MIQGVAYDQEIKFVNTAKNLIKYKIKFRFSV